MPHPASSCNLFNQRSIQPRFNYGQNRPAGNHSFAVTDPSTGARPPRPNFGNFRPPRQPLMSLILHCRQLVILVLITQ